VYKRQEQHDSLNFRTAIAESWGQKEHFRVVDPNTPVTEGGPKCKGCGEKMLEHGEDSVCRNRRCNKRDMVVVSKKKEATATEHTCDVGDHKVHEDVRCVTPDCEHRGKSWETDGHQDWDHDYACSEHFTKVTTASWSQRYAKKESKTFTPPQGVQAAARKALKWIEEGHAGSGFTGVGRGRAHQLANGEAVSLSTIKRMHSFFSRHRVDKQGKDWNKPSPGKVAWYAWGGDAGASWAAGIAKSHGGDSKESSVDDNYANDDSDWRSRYSDLDSDW